MARLNTQPVIAGAAIGAVSAIALMLLPSTALESIIARTNLAAILSAAQPPLGTKARIFIALLPLLLLSGAGLVLGLVWGGRKRKNDYGEYGVYDEYASDDRAAADPFALSDAPIMAGTYEAPPAAEIPLAEPEAAPSAEPLPMPAPPLMATPAPLDGATASDLAEIADAVVRLDARLDAIEGKLGSSTAAPKVTDLSKRLAKIAKSLDEAG